MRINLHYLKTWLPAIVGLLVAFPISAEKTEDQYGNITDDGALLRFKLKSASDFYYVVEPYDSSISGDVNIPDVLYCKLTDAYIPVTEINGFGNTAITSITLGSYITKIWLSTFVGCSALQSVNLNEGLVEISNYAFQQCSSLRSITIPNTVTSIGKGAFEGCSILEEVSLSNNLSVLENSLFKDCTSLTTIDIPSSVTAIGTSYGDGPFSGCTALTTITGMQGVKTIIGFAFADVSSLTSIGSLSSLESLGESAFQNCSALRSITLGPNTANIPKKTFYGCSSLSSINIPASATYIDQYAFYECTSLTQVTGCDNIGVWGNYCFYRCTSLESVSFGSKARSIGSHAFDYCSSLTSVSLPDDIVGTIGTNAFANCSKLSSVHIGNAYTSIGSYAFSKTAITEITVPASVTTIDFGAFNTCEALQDAYINANVTALNFGLFSGCTALTSVTLPETLQSIDERLFKDCGNLTTINIPASVSTIGKMAFYNCKSLAAINLGSCQVSDINENTFYGCSALASVTLPSNLNSIGNQAFYNCSSLASIDIPSSVTSIGESAFNGCKKLTSFTFPATTTTISNFILANCSALASVTIPTTATTVGTSAFAGTALTSISFPESILTVGSHALDNCQALESASFAGASTVLEDAVFYGDAALKSVSLPEGLNRLPANTFYGCSALSSVTLPTTVTSIGEYAFYNSGITSLSVPDKVVTIENDAFAECAALKSVEFHSAALDMPIRAFHNCTALTTITLPAAVENIGAYAFDGCALTKLTIPATVTTLGEYAFRGNPLTNGIICLGTTPASGPDNCFDSAVYSDVKPLVPFGCDAVYATTKPWSNFASLNQGTENPATLLAPVFDPEGGEFESSVTVSISNPNEGGTIYYSIDNAAFQPYTEALTFTENANVRAYILDGSHCSELVSNNYYITRPVVFTQTIIVNGTEVNEKNCFDVFEDKTVSYDYKSQTLSLNNAYIMALKGTGIECNGGTLTIAVNGINEILHGNIGIMFGAGAADENHLIIQGNGYDDKLVINAQTEDCMAGLYAYLSNVSIMNCTLVINQGGVAIEMKPSGMGNDGILNIYDAQVNLYGDNSAMAHVMELNLKGVQILQPVGAYFDGKQEFNINLDVDGKPQYQATCIIGPEPQQELPQITENTNIDPANDWVDENTGDPVDLNNTVINEVYYNLSNTYDAKEECLTLDVTSSVYVDDIIGKDINDEMVAAQYNGMILQVGGTGKITVSFATEGTQQLNVRIGDGEINKFTSDSKIDQSVNYDTDAPVYVYIYATDAAMEKKPGMMREGELPGAVKIYGMSIQPEKVITGVEDISISPDDAPTEHIIFNINGVRCSEPLAPGFYIIDGRKVIIR